MVTDKAERGPDDLEGLRKAILAAGGRALRTSQTRVDTPDLAFELGGRRFVVELKRSTENRIPVLQGLMAAALLQARRHAVRSNAIPLPVVVVRRLTDRTMDAVATFMSREVPEVAWGMIDQSGRRVFRGIDGLDAHGKPRPRAARQRVERDPFSDLGQWMAKVLVAQRLSDRPLWRFLGAPRVPLRRARRLALAARVSEPTAASWVKLLREQGFIDDSTGELRLVRVREFFERWQRAVSAKPRREESARFSLPQGPPDEQLLRALASSFKWTAGDPQVPPDEPILNHELKIEWREGAPRACLSMFEAAGAHRVQFVTGVLPYMYIESTDDKTLQRFGLELTDADSAQVRVVVPHWPESVFRGAVPYFARENLMVPACDIVQTWLDVADHPARGRAQAEEIERHVLDKWVFSDDSTDTGP